MKIDTRAPATSVAGADSRWQSKAKTLTFRAADNAGGSGVAFTLVKLDKGPWTKATTLTIPAPADHSGDGLHTVFYRSVDEAGNREAAHTCAVRIDTRPPQDRRQLGGVGQARQLGRPHLLHGDPRPGSPTADGDDQSQDLVWAARQKAQVGRRSGRQAARGALRLPTRTGTVPVLRVRHGRRRQRAVEGGLEQAHRSLGARRSHACLSGDDEVASTALGARRSHACLSGDNEVASTAWPSRRGSPGSLSGNLWFPSAAAPPRRLPCSLCH